MNFYIFFYFFNLLLLRNSGVWTMKNNVLFIVVDDLRPALGCYGDKNAFTPNIDKLAEKSFLFRNAFAQQALCAPSRNSFLTSRRPDSLHLYHFNSYWRDAVGNFSTLPQHFRENGYYTHSIGKIFHPGISSNFSDDSPYSWTGIPFHPKTQKYKNSKVCLDSDGTFKANLICPVLVENQPLGTLPDLESTEAALNFLKYSKNITNGKPFLLALGFHKPHIPFKFPIEYLKYHPLENISIPDNRWRPSQLPTVAWNPWNDIRRRDDIKKLNVTFPFGPLPDDTIKQIKQAYYAATSYIDDLIGRILKNVDDQTIVILLGDHAWSISEHGEFAKYSNFEVSTKIPLLIHVPKLSLKTIVINELVELVDIFPTLVDLTQISNPLETCSGSNIKLCTEGKSLVNLMTKSTNQTIKSAVFTQYPRPGTFPTAVPDSDTPLLKDIKIMGYSMSTSRYRYSEWVKFNSTTFKADFNVIYGRELYDHVLDNGENMNIVDRNELHDVIKNLSKKLRRGWRHA